MPPHREKLTKARRSTSDGVDNAIETCRQRGAQMTPLRVAVLKELMSAQARPVGAYEMRDLISDAFGREVAAPSIYRTLDFLCEIGVAARIESRKAYVACTHPDHKHACVFLVCDGCGGATEIENAAVEQLIDKDAKRLGFAVKHRVVELSGTCGPCRQAPSS